MSEPAAEPMILIVGTPERRRGRQPLFGMRAKDRLEIRITDEQREDLQCVADFEGRAVSAIVRDAVNEYVSDFRERHVFTRPAPYLPE